MAEPCGNATSNRPSPGEFALLALLGGLGVALRLGGAAGLPWAGEEIPLLSGSRFAGDPPSALAARTVALALGVATVPIAFALLRPRGRAPAIALAALVATSPWHVHVSRLAGATTTAFLLLLCTGAWLASRGRLGGRRLLAGVAAVAALAWAGVALLAPAAPFPSLAARLPPTRLPTLLAGDLGLAVPLLAAIGLWRGGRRAEFAATLVAGGALVTLAARAGVVLDGKAALLAPLLLAAADELGRLLAATASWRAKLAYAIVAVVPTLPSLLSEQIDGGRFDLAPIARGLERVRRGDEPIFASDAPLATRVLGVEALPLQRFSTDPPPEDRDVFLLLLFARGEIVGGEQLGGDVEARLELIERTVGRRFDAARFEARLYRRPASRPQ